MIELTMKNLPPQKTPEGLNPNPKKENKIFVFLTCLFVITWYLQLGVRVGVLGSIRFEFIIGAILTFASISKLISEKSSTPLKGPILLFFSVIMLYTVLSYDHHKSWDIFYNRVLKFSMLALFFTAFIRSEWALKMVIMAFLLAMLKMGQEGFVGWITGSMIWQNQGIPRLHGVTGLYRHPNSFSGMAVGCLPFVFYFYPIANRWWEKAALLALLAFSLIIIVFTGSRTGYVATIFLAVYFWNEKIRENKFKHIILGFFFIAIAFISLPEEYKGRLYSIVTLEEAEGASSSTRIQILKDSISVFFSHPWGVGVGAFPSVRMEMFGRFQDTHNLYLELLTNLSILGVISFSLFIYTIIKCCKQIIRTTPSPLLKSTANAVLAFIYARLFLGLFGMDTYEIYWWFAAGLIMAVMRISEDNKNAPESTINQLEMKKFKKLVR